MDNTARIEGKQRWIIGMVVGCALIYLLSGCSGNKNQADTTPAPKSVSQQSPAPTPPAAPPTESSPTSPAGAGGACAALMTSKCTMCHSAGRICEKLGKKSSSRWQRTIDRMIERGAQLSADESATLLVCLDKGATNDLQAACR